MDYPTIAVTLFILYVCITQTLGQISPDPDCNTTKGCFYDCTLPDDCTFLVTWVDVGNSYAFTIKTAAVNSNIFWTAIGFSDDRIMNNDSVTGCIYKSGNSSIFNALNMPHQEPNLLSSEGVSLKNSSLNNGIYTCTFERLKSAGVNKTRFDLYQPWYLLFAKGPNSKTSSIGYHGRDDEDRVASDVKIFQPSSTEGTTPVSTQLTASTTAVPTQPAGVTTPVPTQPAVVTTPVPTQPAVVTTPVPTTPSEGPTIPKVKGCGYTVGCYSDCVDLTCSFIVSWNINEDSAVYSITSNVDQESQGWVAIGFSQDSFMGDDDVMGCISNTSHQIVPFTAWNVKYSKPDLYTDPEIKLIAKKSENGFLSCTFERPIAASNNRRVDVNKAWTILFAKGPGVITSSGEAAISYHTSEPYISTLPLKASDLVDLGAKYSQHTYPLVKAHGSLMICAWIFFASVGIVVARYYKPVWKFKLLSQSAWFQIHRACMVLAFCLTAIGFIIIFVEVDGYSQIFDSRTYLQGHPIIGIIVMILTVLNPVMAIFRPHPGTPKRPFFNWAHWFVGTSIQILAVVNIFFGVLLTRSDVPYYLVYILGAFVAWQVFVELLLDAISKMCQTLEHKEVYELPNTDEPKVRHGMDSASIVIVKRIILAVHCFIVASFTVVLIVLLALGNKQLGTN